MMIFIANTDTDIRIPISVFDSKERLIMFPLLILMGLLVSLCDTVGTFMVSFDVLNPIFPLLAPQIDGIIKDQDVYKYFRPLLSLSSM